MILVPSIYTFESILYHVVTNRFIDNIRNHHHDDDAINHNLNSNGKTPQFNGNKFYNRLPQEIIKFENLKGYKKKNFNQQINNCTI